MCVACFISSEQWDSLSLSAHIVCVWESEWVSERVWHICMAQPSKCGVCHSWLAIITSLRNMLRCTLTMKWSLDKMLVQFCWVYCPTFFHVGHYLHTGFNHLQRVLRGKVLRLLITLVDWSMTTARHLCLYMHTFAGSDGPAARDVDHPTRPAWPQGYRIQSQKHDLRRPQSRDRWERTPMRYELVGVHIRVSFLLSQLSKQTPTSLRSEPHASSHLITSNSALAGSVTGGDWISHNLLPYPYIYE